MNKYICIIFALCIASSLAGSQLDLLNEYIEKGHEIIEHSFGKYSVKINEELSHFVDTGFEIYDKAFQQYKFEEELKNYDSKQATDDYLYCAKMKESKPFNWMSWNIGVVGNNGDNQNVDLVTDDDTCFKTVNVSYEKTSDSSFKLTFIASGFKGGLTCNNAIQFATAETYYMPVILTVATAKQTINIENQSKEQMESVKYFGLHIFQTCDKITNLVGDLTKTLKLFIGGLSADPKGEGIWNSKPLPEQVQANVDFIKMGTDFQWVKRDNIFVDLDESYLDNGDFIFITRLDGVDNIISWGAGGTVGHTCTVLELEDGHKYVVESQDGWYWPKHGIQRNRWEQWKTWARNADFNVGILKLKPEYQKIMDSNLKKAQDYFHKLEGLPYGYHNFIFGWLDDVKNNTPPVTTFDYIFIVFCQLEKVLPKVTTSFMGEALNFRLGTKGLSLAQIAIESAKRGMTLEDLFGIPENDEWVYSDGLSRVCSAFVIGVLKSGGLFEGLEVQETEFTPRDVYQLEFWDTKQERPNMCKAADPDLPYCQVMGEYEMNIYYDKFGTIKPYNNMFETCPSEPPLFERNTSYPFGC